MSNMAALSLPARRLLWTVVCGVLCFTACTAAQEQSWDSATAESDARRDLAADTAKIYYSGTIAARPAGVPSSLGYLMKNLPRADAGCGCVVRDMALRKRQQAYAALYNQTVIRELLRREGHAPAVLDQELKKSELNPEDGK